MYEVRRLKIASPRFGPSYCGYLGDLAATFDIRLTAISHRRLATAAASVLQLLLWWARKNRASVRGGNLLDGGSEKCAHYSYHQDRNPESAFHGFVSYPRKVSPDGSLAR